MRPFGLLEWDGTSVFFGVFLISLTIDKLGASKEMLSGDRSFGVEFVWAILYWPFW
jgi:hypothetical protein